LKKPTQSQRSGPKKPSNSGSRANTYTGDTTVSGGTLSLAAPNLDDDSAVSVATGATLNLGFTGPDTIASLTLGAAPPLDPGTYDRSTHPDYLSGDGQLVVVPQLDTFGSWATGLGLTGVATDDFDNDGLPDALEFVLGTDPKVSDTPSITSDSSGDNLVLTFDRDDRSETADLTLQVEAGTNLVDWPQLFTVADTSGNSTPGVTILENGDAADTITVIIPKNGATSLFTRIKAIVAGE
jgi:hypothetical protein